MLSPTQDPTPRSIPGSHVPVLFGPGVLRNLGVAARHLNAQRVLVVSDAGIVKAGHLDSALGSLRKVGLDCAAFTDVEENPTERVVEDGLVTARDFRPDLVVGLGGGSSMDTAKGINFVYTNGGRMRDYWGTNKAAKPMLPLIAIPTTAGTGSEAQSYALISDPETHTKMACGDSKALPRLAILDPELTRTQPPRIAALTGIDAVAHAIETAGCTRRTEISRRFSAEAWRLLESAYERAIADANDSDARENMLLGAHLAGCAIENSMLGAAHAAANPLTAAFGAAHGAAVGLMLPHVIRFNARFENPYSDLMPDADALARRVERMLQAAGLPMRLADLEVENSAIPALAAAAAKQWTATFNPRQVGESEFLSIYRSAHGQVDERFPASL